MAGVNKGRHLGRGRTVMRASIFYSILCGVIFCLSFQGSIPAATWFVDASVSQSGDGTSWETAFKTVQEGINAAGAGDTVIVAKGRYLENVKFSPKAITVRSTDPGDRDVVAATVIDGNNAGRVVSFDSGTYSGMVLSGFTITGGKAESGGGIYCVGRSPEIRSNIIEGNSAKDGGGIFGRACAPTIADNIIRNNGADNIGGGLHLTWSAASVSDNTIADNYAMKGGGGIYCEKSPVPLISGNFIMGNFGGEGGGGGIYCYECNAAITGNLIAENRSPSSYPKGGGGILCYRCSPTIAECIISDNCTHYGGGGIFCDGSSPRIERNLICRNGTCGCIQSSEGGGIYCYGDYTVGQSSPLIAQNTISENSAHLGAGIRLVGLSSATIVNNVFARNRAEGCYSDERESRGGAIGCQTATGVIVNNTIFGCRARRGGGVYCAEDSTLTVRNCILWDNGDDLDGCSATYSCIEDGDPGEGNIFFFPHFVNEEAGDFHVQPWSPCIDAGDPSSDFSKEPQPNGRRVNMGAYGNTPKATCKSPDTDSDAIPDAWEEHWFGDLSRSGVEDEDGDGILNLDEYLFGENPSVPSPVRIHNLRTNRFYPSIQSAINQAREGDQVVVLPGVYRENISFPGRDIVLRSLEPDDPDCVAATVIDGQGNGSVVKFCRGETNLALLSGLTITGGRAEYGGGIYCQDSSPTITRCDIKDNVAGRGGGIYCGGDCLAIVKDNTIRDNLVQDGGGGICCWECSPEIVGNVISENEAMERGSGGGVLCYSGSASIKENTIRRNRAQFGGGISCDSFSVVRENTIEENSAGFGGGIHCEGCVTIIGNTITANRAEDSFYYEEWGGGIYCESSTGSPEFPATVISFNVISQNYSRSRSGGIHCEGGNPIISRNTISNNYAGSEGGGVVFWWECTAMMANNVVHSNSAGGWGGGACVRIDSSPTITSNTFAGNHAGGSGGGVLVDDWSQATISRCIFWDNADDLVGASPTFSCLQYATPGNGNIAYEPYFVDPDNDDYHLESWSPCIGMGAYAGTDEETERSPDTDSDKLPDSWEEMCFGDLSQGPRDDPNFDGITNLTAYRYGGNPAMAPSPDRVQNLRTGLIYPKVRAAIAQAKDGDEIVVYPGKYEENISFAGKAIALRSVAPEDPGIVAGTVIEGTLPWSVVRFWNEEEADSVISGLTITGGKAVYSGGGISCRSASPTIAKCAVTGNRAEMSGGGIDIADESSPALLNCVVSHNSSPEGGGIAMGWNCAPEIKGCTITGNCADSYGGGICCQQALPVINSTRIEKNSAGQNGGGIFCRYRSHLTLTNCLIVENTASGSGGAIYNDISSSYYDSSVVTVSNATIAFNWALSMGGIWGSASVMNGILWNENGDLSGGSISYSCVRDLDVYPAEGEPWNVWERDQNNSFSSFPYFVDPAKSDYHLLPWSPCIDVGDPTSDFSKEPEPNGGRINMGAYGNTPEAASKSPDSDGDGLPDGWEVAWFGDLSQGAKADPDRDWLANLDEYFNGLDPTRPRGIGVLNARTHRLYSRIQQAIDEAGDADEIVVHPGTYEENIDFRGKAITLRSANPMDRCVVADTVIRPRGYGCVVKFVSGEGNNSRISGLTITGGEGYEWYEDDNAMDDPGGGIHCSGSSPTISNNIITDNTTLWMIGGGGICCENNANALIIHNIVSSNSSYIGGGIHCSNSSPTISGNTITGNSASSCGGGISCSNSSPVIQNNVIVQNSASEDGGGVYCSGGAPHIASNTIVNNSAPRGAKGIHCEDSSATVTNCIIWNGGLELQGCSVTYSCVRGGAPGQGNFYAFPYFVDAPNCDYRLLSWSPCIDAGDPGSDFSNEPQPNGGRINAGAFGNTGDAAPSYNDIDHDDLPDEWEIAFLGGIKQGPEDDFDGDRIRNLIEFRFGWNPAVPCINRVCSCGKCEWYEEIQPAISEAEEGDEIVVHPGIYEENLVIPGRQLILRSLDPSDQAIVAVTVIKAAGAGSVIRIEPGGGRELTISGFTITGGDSTYGGGIYCCDASATISDNLITSNSSQYGGGMYCLRSSSLITCNRITDNYSYDLGGGIFGEESAVVVVSNRILRNTVDYGGGGGISCVEGSATIRENIIRGNYITRDSTRGGGIYCGASTAYICGNTIVDNYGGNGGCGIQLYKSNATVCGNVISGNRIYYWGEGGGIACEESTATITNNTIVNNSGAYECNGIYSYKSSTTVANCILWGNGDDLYGCQATYSCIENQDPGEGNIHENPLFVDASGGDFHLLPQSPCIDAGSNDAPDIPARDMDGEYRPFGPSVDMGADEFVDQDHDELPDYWEISSFGHLLFGPSDDPDSDGLSNAEEMLHCTLADNSDSDGDGQKDGDELKAGVDPLNSQLLFTVRRVGMEGENVSIECSSVPGRAYQLFFSSDLLEWSPVGDPTIAYRSTVKFIHAGAPGGKSFYRISVLP
jgi:hypothetical protein